MAQSAERSANRNGAKKELVMGSDLKAEARQIFEAGLKAVDPKAAVKRFMAFKGINLQIGVMEIDL